MQKVVHDAINEIWLYVVVCVLYQSEVPSCVQAVASDMHFTASATNSYMKPDVVLEKLDLSW